MIKDYLRSVRKLKLDIEAKKRERDTLYMTLTGTTIRPKEVDVQTSVGGDVFGDRMAIVADYDRELEEEIINLIREQHKANQIINTLTVAEYRAVLTDYYINGYTWLKVAELNGYALRTVHKIHGTALNNLKECTLLHYDV